MNKLAYSLILLLAVGCAKKVSEDNDLAISSTTAEVESGSTAVTGLLDEQAGNNYAMTSSPQKSIFDLIAPKAFAATCMRPTFSSCQSGIKAATYSDCEIGPFSISGSAQLQYSQSGCTMNATTDTVTRTYDLVRSGLHGGSLNTTSSAKSDYRNGSAYGGGGRLTKTPSGFSLDILGKHKALTFRGRSVYDISIRTIAPLQISGGLDRSSRNIQSGQLEINHNRAERTAVWTYNNVQFSSLCCHPVSGTIDIVWSGSKTGSAQMTFQGCGLAQVTEGGQSSQVEMSYCE
jgi:hypothetical protein